MQILLILKFSFLNRHWQQASNVISNVIFVLNLYTYPSNNEVLLHHHHNILQTL